MGGYKPPAGAPRKPSLQVASKIHNFEELVGPSVAADTRSITLSRTAFSASPSESSLRFREIVQGGTDPEWYSPSADRHSTSHADLEVAAEACAGPVFQDEVVANTWMGAVIHWTHMLAVRKVGSRQWLLGLGNCAGSAAFFWPVSLKSCPGDGGADYFVPEFGVRPVLMCITSFDSWEATKFRPRSPSWQHRELPQSAPLLRIQGLRLMKSGPVKPLLEVAAAAAFWNLGKAWLVQLMGSLGMPVPPGSSLLDILWAVVAHVTKGGDDEVSAFVEQRLVLLHRDLEASDVAYAQVEELSDVLERRDEKALEEKAKALTSDQADLEDVREKFKERVRQLPGHKSRKIVDSRGKAYRRSFPQGTIAHATAKLMCPPGGFLWRALTDGRWCGRLPPYSEFSRSWAKYSEQLALKLVLQEMWRQYLSRNGRELSDCPIEGMFSE